MFNSRTRTYSNQQGSNNPAQAVAAAVLASCRLLLLLALPHSSAASNEHNIAFLFHRLKTNSIYCSA
jgi:hypothetical protein